MGLDSNRNLSGKIYDPVFLCMLGAIILAIGSSVALRAVVAGAGPSAARGSTVDDQDDPDRTVRAATHPNPK